MRTEKQTITFRLFTLDEDGQRNFLGPIFMSLFAARMFKDQGRGLPPVEILRTATTTIVETEVVD